MKASQAIEKTIEATRRKIFDAIDEAAMKTKNDCGVYIYNKHIAMFEEELRELGYEVEKTQHNTLHIKWG